MKDGSRFSGYVEWGVEYPPKPFAPGECLAQWRNRPVGYTGFSIFKVVYPINDGTKSPGLAYTKEDLIKLDSKKVAGMVSTPDSHEGWITNCRFPELTKEEISNMQAPAAYTDDVAVGDYADATVYCYDPKIAKKKLHRLLLDYVHFVQSDKSHVDREKWLGKLPGLKAVFILRGV